MTNHPKFVETAKAWTTTYASQIEQDEKVYSISIFPGIMLV